MWLSFWRPRNRFSIDELRYLTEQLEKVQVVNDVNKEFVIEALRSIAELITYGDQHDSSFFEFFMEKQIMGEFVRILRISQPVKVALQLLQTMSIMIQNLKSEHAIYYIFSNEHINYLITYSFDFHNDELLSYYISFLRAISVKLNKNTIPLLVKIQNDHVVSFPLYVEAIKFAFHEESMIRTAVRALTLNVYHVGDEYVNKYVSSIPQADYFSNLVKYFQKQCFALDGRVSKALGNPDSHDAISSILTMVDEIEDSLYFISDVISAGIPEIGRLITDNILQFLVFPSLLPSLGKQTTDKEISITTSLYLLCCVLRIVKTKELASSVAAALFLPPGVFIPKFDATANGSTMEQQVPAIPEQEKAFSSPSYPESKQRRDPCSLCHLNLQNNISNSLVSLRGMLLSYVVSGHDVQALGSLCLLATLLQTKELDESMLDGLGILPQRKQHKKLLLQALVGEESGEEQLFSPKNNRVDDRIDTELDIYLQKIQDHLQLSCTKGEPLTSPQKHRKEVLDALVCLFCRCNLSAETLWIGGWLLRQLLPHGEQEFTISHLQQLKDAHRDSIANLFGEARGTWCDILLVILKDEWKNCKRAIEGSSPLRDPKSILVPTRTFSSGGESSFAAGQRMSEIVKVFVLQQQLLIFSNGGYLAEQPPLSSPLNSPLNHRSETADFDAFAPKSGSEISAENAVPCRIAFERGKERHLSFLAISKGVSGWIILLEELQPNQRHGVVRVTAPLAGSNPRIDEKHPKWLHLRIRPSALSLLDPNHEPFARAKPKLLVDGRWTLAFRDDDACRSAQSMVIKELHQLQNQVEQMLKPFVDDQITTNSQNFLPNSSGELPEDAGR